MKKTTLLAIVTISFIAGTIASSTLAVADASTQGQPFQALQAAIQSLQTQMSNLQTQVNSIQLTPGPQGPAGATGAQGPQGPAGATGAQGPQGPAGVATVNIYTRLGVFTVPAHASIEPFATVHCSPGDKIISGGFAATPLVLISLSAPDPSSDPQGWMVSGQNTADAPESISVYATCEH